MPYVIRDSIAQARGRGKEPNGKEEEPDECTARLLEGELSRAGVLYESWLPAGCQSGN